MKKYSRIIMTIFALLLVLLWAVYTMISHGNNKEQKKISVILTGSNEDRWFAVENGMNQAAIDNNVILSYANVSQNPTARDEWDIIQREIYENGADAVIVEPMGKEVLIDDAKNGYKLPVVLLDSDVEPEGVYDCIHADDEEIGRLLADKLYEKYGSYIKYKKIGVVGGVASRLSMTQRMVGFCDRLREYDAKPAWTMGLGHNLEPHLMRQLERSTPDIVVALGNYETEVSIDLILGSGLENNIEVYGEGYSEKTVYYLGKGVVDCLVVPNEYTMGYLAVQQAANKANKISSKYDNSPIMLHSIRTDELYLEENQKILFPHLQ